MEQKENGTIKDKLIRDIRTLFEHEDDYLNPIDFRALLIFAQHECAKINIARTRLFFAQFDERKLKYHFRLEFDCILQYFSPPLFYTIHLRVNKAEKENPTETFRHILFSQVKSYKDKNVSVGSLLLRIIP